MYNRVKEQNRMNKYDLKTGMIVVTKEDTYTVLLNTGYDDENVMVSSEGWMRLSDYDENFNLKDLAFSHDFDINRVYSFRPWNKLADISDIDSEILWERK
jgi:hypothetical protein